MSDQGDDVIVFEIIKTEKVDNEWILGGLVLEDFAIGDKVWLRQDQNVYHFTVKKITTYGHQFDEIGRGMSAYLTLSGKAEVVTRSAHYLRRSTHR